MRYWNNKLLLIILFGVVGLFANASNVNVKAAIDSSFLMIGDQTRIRFEVNQEKGEKVQFPILSDTIVKGIEIVERSKFDTLEQKDGRITVSTDILVTSFDSALYYIPPFQFVAADDTLETNPLSLKVYTLEVDTISKQVFDIKPVYKPPFNWAKFFIIILIVLSIAALAVFLFFYIKKIRGNKQVEEELKMVPLEKASVIALRELERIRNEKIWQQGRIKEYYTDVTQVVRQYIEHRFCIQALEMTTDEILQEMRLQRLLEKEVEEKLKQTLLLADLVKFAKWTPAFDDNDRTLTTAFSFVEETIEKEEKVDDEDTETDKDLIVTGE